MPASPEPRPRRKTAKQEAVLEALNHSDRFRSAQQLHFEIRQHRAMRIGLTSVYRILKRLADDHIAETERAEDGETLYRLRTAADHRHYLLCRQCGRAIGFIPATLEQHTSRLAEQHHFTEITHHIDLYGTCPLCNETPTAGFEDCP
jgi:Fur family transcriptional regulator, ferric uptake regulator